MVAAGKRTHRWIYVGMLLLSMLAWCLIPLSGVVSAEPEFAPGQKAYKLVESMPKDGSIVSATPKEIRLTFSEPIKIKYASIFDNRNREYSTGKIKVNPQDARQIILTPAKELLPGTYGVEWQVEASSTIDEEDKDLKRVGQIYFAVQSLSPAPKSAGAGLIEQLSRETLPNWLAFFGMAISFGGTFFVQFIARKEDIHKRWQYWQIPIYFLTATAVMVLFFVRKAALPEATLNELAALPIGWIPLVQFFVFALIFGISFTRWTLPFVGAMLALNAWVGRSYSPEYGSWIAVLMDLIHLFALSIWFGGLFALVVLAPKEGRWEWFKEKGAEFSRWALISMILLMLTGIAMTVDYADSWNDFIRSIWGLTILVKVALVACIALLGVLQLRAMRKGSEKNTRWLIRRAKWRVGLGIAVLLISAALVNFAPIASEVGGIPAKVTKQGSTAYATISPFVSGFNEVNIRFENAPAIKEVYVRFSELPEYNALNRAFDLGNGRYLISGDQLRVPSAAYINVEAVTQDGRIIVYTFPPRGTAWCDI